MKRIDYIFLTILLVISVFFVFYRLGEASLENWDEGYYAQMAHEFIEKPGLVSTFEGRYWLQKPPLGIWLQAAGMLVFGDGNFGIRFVPGLLFVFSVLVFYLIVRNFLQSRTAFISSLFFFFSPFFYYTHLIRTGDLESSYILFVLLSIYFYTRSWEKSRYILLASLFSGLAFLVRGYMAILISGIIFFHLMISKKTASYSFKEKVSAILIYLFTVLPWHIYAYFIAKQQFLNDYLGLNLITRITTSLSGNSSTPLYYVNFLKWRLGFIFFVILAAFVYQIFRISEYRRNFDILIFSWVIIYGTGLFFTKTIYFWYLAGIIPALYLILTIFVDDLYHKMKKYIKNRNLAVVIIALVITIPLLRNISDAVKYITKPGGRKPVDYISRYLKENGYTNELFVIYNENFEDGPAITYTWSTKEGYNYRISDKKNLQDLRSNEKVKLIFSRERELEDIYDSSPGVKWKKEVFSPYTGQNGGKMEVVVLSK